MQLPTQSRVLPTADAAPYVLEVRGELDLHTQEAFESAVCAQLGSGSVVVDFSELEFLSISSLRSLLLCRRSATAADKSLSYVGAPGQARRLVAVAGLTDEL